MIILLSSITQSHGGGGSSISIHPKRMEFGAISFGSHQGPVVMKEAAQLGGVDGNVSTIFKKSVNTLHSYRRPYILLLIHSFLLLLLLLSFQSIKMVSSFIVCESEV